MVDFAKLWRPIKSAPKDGTPICIRGLTFIDEKPYEAIAVWATRKCPVTQADGWFPASDKHDGQGPYLNVEEWRPLDAMEA